MTTPFGRPEPSVSPRLTLAENLDAAKDGQEFLAVLDGLFARLDRRVELEDDE